MLRLKCETVWTYVIEDDIPEDIVAELFNYSTWYYTRWDEERKITTPYPMKKERIWKLYAKKRFNTGFISKLADKLKENNIPFEVENACFQPTPKFDFKTPLDSYFKRMNRQPFYYQLNAVKACIESNGILQIGTGGGKTITYALLTAEFGVKTIVITIDNTSREQTYEEFVAFFGEENVAHIDQDYIEKPILIANVQGIHARLKKEDPEFLEYIIDCGLLIVNEAHHLNESGLGKETIGNTWFNAVINIPAYYRYAATGTLEKKGTFSRALLEGGIGSLIYTKTTRELIDEGYACEIEVHVYRMLFKNDEHTNYVKAYTNMVTNEVFNTFLVDVAKKYADDGKRVIIFADWVEKQAEVLKEKLGDRCALVHGGIKGKERKDTINNFEMLNCDILLGTVFSEDFDLPALDVGIVIGKKKNERSLKQRVGRVGRLSNGKKHGIIVIPFLKDEREKWDNNLKKYVKSPGILATHSQNAIDILKEQGYKIVEKTL